MTWWFAWTVSPTVVLMPLCASWSLDYSPTGSSALSIVFGLFPKAPPGKLWLCTQLPSSQPLLWAKENFCIATMSQRMPGYLGEGHSGSFTYTLFLGTLQVVSGNPVSHSSLMTANWMSLSLQFPFNMLSLLGRVGGHMCASTSLSFTYPK